jgi:hypothetical protein
MLRALALIFVATLAGSRLQAQGMVELPMPFVMKDAKATITDMKGALRNLITAQEKYWNEHGTYTTDGNSLGVYPSKAGEASVQVIFAGSRGWTGMATDRALKGKSCVVFIGVENELPGGAPKTMGAGIAAQTEAVPVCDKP